MQGGIAAGIDVKRPLLDFIIPTGRCAARAIHTIRLLIDPRYLYFHHMTLTLTHVTNELENMETNLNAEIMISPKEAR